MDVAAGSELRCDFLSIPPYIKEVYIAVSEAVASLVFSGVLLRESLALLRSWGSSVLRFVRIGPF